MTPIDERLEADPVVNKIVQLGYCIAYEFRPDGRYLDFRVTHQGRPAGSATMGLRTGSREVAVELINTYDGHKRKGVATALYVCAKLLTGFALVRAASQTEDGRALWDQPNRPW